MDEEVKVEEIAEDIDDTLEEVTPEETKVIVEPIDDEAKVVSEPTKVLQWDAKTDIGRKVKAGEISDIDTILDSGMRILEMEIVDALLPELEVELLLIGQAKGKFGGGQRRIFKQTQKKTKEGNKPKFKTCAAVGNMNGYLGMGFGKSKETVPAREKSIRNAKMSIMKVRRGCGSWQCGCKTPHSVPYSISGKCGSTIMTLIPAPKGTGLKVEKECAKMLKLAGYKDMWSATAGQTKTKTNLVVACIDALSNLSTAKTRHEDFSILGIVDGKISEEKSE